MGERRRDGRGRKREKWASGRGQGGAERGKKGKEGEGAWGKVGAMREKKGREEEREGMGRRRRGQKGRSEKAWAD